MSRKFEIGDRIVDHSPEWGTGTIVDYDTDPWMKNESLYYYAVQYDRDVNGDTPMFPTTGCPENEMRKMTKLDKALK